MDPCLGSTINLSSAIWLFMPYPRLKGRPLDNLEFMQWMKRYCDSVCGGAQGSYNPLERRETSKGGKDTQRKQAPKNQSSHTSQKNEETASHAPITENRKIFGIGAGQAYDEHITELKLFVDSPEKERDFYFAKLRDIEILCQSSALENLPIKNVIQSILYSTEDTPSVHAEAQAMIIQEEPLCSSFLSPIQEMMEERPQQEAQKRKDICKIEVDMEANSKSSPRQRLSDISNLGDSPLIDF